MSVYFYFIIIESIFTLSRDSVTLDGVLIANRI
jgi:hypothetical protein